jgi:hypothetical protein
VTVRRVSDARLTELARGIVVREYVIADDRREWLTSLALVGGVLARHHNLGAVLVPVGPHLGGYWINGIAPGVTLQCTAVAKGDLPALQRKVDAMRAALYPEGEATS